MKPIVFTDDMLLAIYEDVRNWLLELHELPHEKCNISECPLEHFSERVDPEEIFLRQSILKKYEDRRADKLTAELNHKFRAFHANNPEWKKMVVDRAQKAGVPLTELTNVIGIKQIIVEEARILSEMDVLKK